MRVRTVTRRRAPVDALLVALGAALVAFLLGGWGAPWLSAHTSARALLDPSRYQLVVPGVKATGKSLAKVARSGLVDGSLALETREVGAPERLVPQTERVADLQMRLVPGSDPVVLNARTVDGNQMQIATFYAEGWMTPSGVSHAYVDPGVAHVQFVDGQAVVDGQRVIAAAGGGVELSPLGNARIRWLRLADADGAVLLEDDFSAATGASSRLGWGLAAGMAAGLFAFAFAHREASLTGRVLLCAAVALPATVVTVPYTSWTGLVELLYLADVDMTELRRGLLLASGLPAALIAASMSSLLDLSKTRLPTMSWGLVVGIEVAVAGVASRDLSGVGWALLPLALLSGGLTGRAARASGTSPSAWLLREAPVLLLAAALGWGPGLLVLTGWRLFGLTIDAPRLLERGARAGADAFLALILLLPFATEVALRGTTVDHSWDADVLAGASVGGPATMAMEVPFWTASCGNDTPANVYAFGGSSTGGAWQFRGDPTAFFPAQLHERLCAAGLSIRSLNYGEGGRDSFDVAVGAPPLFAIDPPAVVILYLGVNDLLTRDSPLTRKQRMQKLSSRAAATTWLARLGSSSRLLTGIRLLVRPRAEASLVEAVPLPDAEENVRAVTAAVVASGGRVLLVPELTRAAERAQIEDYAQMLTRLGGDLPGASVVDARAAIGSALEELMTDRNHLSAEGGDALAAALEEPVKRALGVAP